MKLESTNLAAARRSRLRVVLFVALALSAVSLLFGSTQESNEFASLAEFETSLERAALSGDIEPFWAGVVRQGRMPLVFGRTAVFLFRGDAQTVEWRGDAAGWSPSWETLGERVGGTDIWRKTIQLLPRSRLDYKIVVDGDEWLLDPLNPDQQVGGYGPNSELRMPGWEPSPWIERREDTPAGDFTEDIPFASERLGYSVNYRVYKPPSPAGDATNLPVLYVTDGSDYWRDEMGSFVIVLDNLYAAGKIRPILVVFIDPWDREAGVNRREQELVPGPEGQCSFCEFLVEELVPAIDEAYSTDRSAARRAILGTSLGGLHATFMGLSYPHVFGAIGIQSPSYWRARWVLDRLAATESYPPRVFLNIGEYERWYLEDARTVAKRLDQLEVNLLYLELPAGHSWGHWRTTIDDLLLFFYGDEQGAPAARTPSHPPSDAATPKTGSLPTSGSREAM
jgi:enterochelin esterase family protein